MVDHKERAVAIAAIYKARSASCRERAAASKDLVVKTTYGSLIPTRYWRTAYHCFRILVRCRNRLPFRAWLRDWRRRTSSRAIRKGGSKMATTRINLHQATQLVTDAIKRVAAQRTVVTTSSASHIEAIERLESYTDLLATAVQHLEDVRLNVMAGRGNGATLI